MVISQLYVWHGLAVPAKLEPHREPLGQTFPSYDCMAGRILRLGTSIFHTRDGRGVSSGLCSQCVCFFSIQARLLVIFWYMQAWKGLPGSAWHVPGQKFK